MTRPGISPIAVANYFLAKSLATGIPLEPMKLIKMVYIAHGWHLVRKGRPLLTEAILAWKFGPVIESLYHKVKQFRDEPITSLITVQTQNGLDAPTIDDAETQRFLDSVWNAYQQFTGLQLSTLTHRSDTAWYEVWHNRNGKNERNALIPNDLIAKHYGQLDNARR